MRESGKVDQTIMHCIFVRPPGVGKSSLLKRLLRMKLDSIESTITQASGHIGPVPTKQTRENLSTVGDSNEQFSEQTVQVPISTALSRMGTEEVRLLGRIY